MTITKKDRLFATCAIPVALIAAYVWFFGFPLQKQVLSMESRVSALGSEETLGSQKKALAARLARARKELAEIEAAAAAKPESGMIAAAGADDATRLANLCAVIRSCHIRIVSCSLQDHSHADNSGSSSGLLSKIGVKTPATWIIIVEAPYRDITQFLALLAQKRFPIVPETVSMIRGIGYDKPNFWKMRFCL